MSTFSAMCQVPPAFTPVAFHLRESEAAAPVCSKAKVGALESGWLIQKSRSTLSAPESLTRQ